MCILRACPSIAHETERLIRGSELETHIDKELLAL